MKSQGSLKIKPELQKSLEKLNVSSLPDAPGVYFFLNSADEVLYVGRATSLRDRVRSYFSDDLISTRGPLIVDMMFQSTKIDFIQTDSVLEAVILEANLIKKHQPRCNTKEKSDKSFYHVVITDEEFPRVKMVRGKDLKTLDSFKVKDKERAATKQKVLGVFGPYTSGQVLTRGLKLIRKIFPFRDRCEPEMGRPCFNRQLGLCPGVCTGEISSKEYQKIIKHLILFLKGEKTRVTRSLEREMLVRAKAREFEKAGELKKTLFALKHIQDISLIRDDESRSVEPSAPEAFFRIEGYDVAHLSGKNTVGVMTVLEDKQIKKSDYRLFKIRTDKSDDIASLRQILERRLGHPEWPYPNLIVVDGSIAQRKVAEAVLAEKGFDIAVAAVVKNDKHRPDGIIVRPGDRRIDRNFIKKYTKEILLVNSEAHRFAIKHHRKLRGTIKRI